MAAAADLDFGKNDLQFHCTYTQFAEICCPDVKLHKIVGWPKLLYYIEKTAYSLSNVV